MEKDNTYWTLHKETYNKLMQELDTDIIRKIYSNPNCVESRLLEKRVSREMEDKIKLQES